MSNRGYNRPQKRRMFRRGFAIALVFVCILILLTDRQQKSMLASGRLTADDLSSKIMGVIATPLRGIESIFLGAEERKNVYENNISLRAEVERLQGYENKVLDMEMRVRRFEEMLSLNSVAEIADTRIIARAVSETKGPFVHSALINAGQNKAVEVGNAVMTTDGLYGHIVRRGSVSARVLLLNDLSSRISVMSQRSQSRAIMIGNNTNRPKLAYVSLDADWQIGDRVVTSGDGGVLPRGLQIGRVVGDNPQDLQVQLFYLSKPVDWVWVHPFAKIPIPQDPQGGESKETALVGAENIPTGKTSE